MEEGQNRVAGQSLFSSKFTTYTIRNGLSSDLVKTILGDRSGHVWVGTDGGGLNLLKDGRFTKYTRIF